MGASLPSVKAGTPYAPINTSRGINDYSAVVFPADPSDPRRCETCHSQKTGAAQATAYMTNPTRAACGSCHDDVNFATGVNHVGGPQFDDNQCSNCHIPQGEMDFDASIKGAHVAPTASTLLTGLSVKITSVNGSAGKPPTVAFTMLDNKGAAVPFSTATLTVSATMTGPTTDYGNTNFGSDTTATPGYVTESMTATTASCTGAGACLYTFTHPVPAGSKGTFAIGIEARRSETVLAGTTSAQSITYATPNPVAYFSVDGSPVAPRRTVVGTATATCNACHVNLQLHGGLRNNTDYCVFCHNPSNTDFTTRPTATTVADRTLSNEGINFNLMVHRIHYGINMQASNRTYVVVGHGGSHNDFSSTLFPAMTPGGSPLDTENCSMCHVNSSEMNLPTGKNAVVDPQGPYTPIQAVASACTGCHVDIPTAVHALTNTTQLGEACAVCHSSRRSLCCRSSACAILIKYLICTSLAMVAMLARGQQKPSPGYRRIGNLPGLSRRYLQRVSEKPPCGGGDR